MFPAMESHAITLTSTEAQILTLLAEELTSNEIAAQLGISLLEVNEIRKSLLEKSGCSGIVSLVKFAIRHGFLQQYQFVR